MKNRSSIIWLVAVMMACSAVFSSAGRRDEITLVMVPREKAPVRLGLDIAGKYPTLLVSYKLEKNGQASLHGWTGTKWVNIAPSHFTDGKFFSNPPNSALIVETKDAPVFGKLIPSEAWCPGVSKITTTELRPLIHLVGQYYNFGSKDWKWFATRYNMEMDAINPEGLNMAWYDKRLSEHLKPHDTSKSGNDLLYWVSIRQPVVSEPAEPGTGTPESETAEEPGNPFTNEVPSAVIMGAPGAPEEKQ